MHTLSLVQGPVTWVVVEAGGISKEATELLAQARVHSVLSFFFDSPKPNLGAEDFVFAATKCCATIESSKSIGFVALIVSLLPHLKEIGRRVGEICGTEQAVTDFQAPL